MRTLEGGNVHKQMMILAKDYLEKQGYTVVLRAQIGSNSGVIDVLGIRNGEKVAVECQIVPSQAIMQQKLDRIKPYITRLLLAVPRNVTPHDIPAEIEVLKLDVDRPVPEGVRIVIKLSDEGDRLLRHEGGNKSETVDRLIKKEFGSKPASV